MTDQITLKWGTLKAWDLKSPAALKAAKNYIDAGENSVSAMMQHDTDDQKKALCDLIDALDASGVWNDWDGAEMTKEQAKDYIMGYGK